MSFLRNWKTTLAGILTGGPLLACQFFHICSVGHFGSGDWLQVVSGVGAVLTGFLAKDHDVTGGVRPNVK